MRTGTPCLKVKPSASLEGRLGSLTSCKLCLKMYEVFDLSRTGNERAPTGWRARTLVYGGTPQRSFYGQAERAISNGELHALLRFHLRPIDVIVYHGPSGRSHLEEGFALICLQRLS